MRHGPWLWQTDCVKDRLAGYHHWNDRQCLEQALLVAEHNRIDLEEVRRWSEHERKDAEFARILPRFRDAQRRQSRTSQAGTVRSAGPTPGILEADITGYSILVADSLDPFSL